MVAEISADRINEELRVTTNDRIRTRMELSAVFPGIYPGAEATVYQPACGSLWNGQRQADRPNGICAYDGTDYSDRDYFKRSMQEVVVSDPSDLEVRRQT